MGDSILPTTYEGNQETPLNWAANLLKAWGTHKKSVQVLDLYLGLPAAIATRWGPTTGDTKLLREHRGPSSSQSYQSIQGTNLWEGLGDRYCSSMAIFCFRWPICPWSCRVFTECSRCQRAVNVVVVLIGQRIWEFLYPTEVQERPLLGENCLEIHSWRWAKQELVQNEWNISQIQNIWLGKRTWHASIFTVVMWKMSHENQMKCSDSALTRMLTTWATFFLQKLMQDARVQALRGPKKRCLFTRFSRTDFSSCSQFCSTYLVWNTPRLFARLVALQHTPMKLGYFVTWSHGPMINHLVSSLGGVFFGEAFDDETSTFTCRTAESQSDGSVMNRAGYNITLCPEAPDFERMGAFENQARDQKNEGTWKAL